MTHLLDTRRFECSFVKLEDNQQRVSLPQGGALGKESLYIVLQLSPVLSFVGRLVRLDHVGRLKLELCQLETYQIGQVLDNANEGFLLKAAGAVRCCPYLL